MIAELAQKTDPYASRAAHMRLMGLPGKPEARLIAAPSNSLHDAISTRALRGKKEQAERERLERERRQANLAAEKEAARISAVRRKRNSIGAIKRIQLVIAARYDVLVLDICSARRTADVVLPRQIAMYFARKCTPRSLPEIGRIFGGRDHTTVLHAVNKIARLRGSDSVFGAEMATLENELAELSAQSLAEAQGDAA